MIKEILFILWTFIIPILVWLDNRFITGRKDFVAGKKPYVKPLFIKSNLFPVFCQDVVLLTPIIGIILCLWDCFYEYTSYPAELMGILCLVQLTILDLIRGLRIKVSPHGFIHYNKVFFAVVCFLTILHIYSVKDLMYSWGISLFSLMFVSVSSSVSTWQYIENIYRGKGKV